MCSSDLGLWEFPRVTCNPGETPQEGAKRAGREVVGLPVEIGARVGKVSHAVTHHKITLYGYIATPLHTQAQISPQAGRDLRWLSPERLEDYALSFPQALLRNALSTFLVQQGRGAVQQTLDLEE